MAPHLNEFADEDVLPEFNDGTTTTTAMDVEGGGGRNSTTTTGGVVIEGNNNNNNNVKGGGRWNMREILKRDWRVLLIGLVVLLLMNIPFGRYILYPFTIFSTWIHELCHGIAALMVGGRIHKLLIFPDGSGLAVTSIPRGRAFVASAGYQGTAVVGFLLLLFRRTKRGPRSGIMILAFVMILTTFIWIRNVFGFFMIPLLAILLGICGWKLPSARMRDVYVLVATTCSLNAITSVRGLFGGNLTVNGEPSGSDAHTVADQIGGPFWIWAILWLLFAILMTFLGLIFAIPGPDEVADFKFCALWIDLRDWWDERKRRRVGGGGGGVGGGQEVQSSS